MRLCFEPAFPSASIPLVRLYCSFLQPTLLVAFFSSTTCAYTCLTQDAFDHYQGDQFQNFDQYAAHFNTQTPTFPGPPTPPNQQHPAAAIVHNGQPHNASHHGMNGSGVSALKTAHQLADGLPVTKTEPIAELENGMNGRRQGSNSADEDDLTPAQSRRKAQNRAA